MTKQEVQSLFERIFKQLSSTAHPTELRLIYTHGAGIFGERHWHIFIDTIWGTPWQIHNEQDWLRYKIAHAVLETDEDLERYADAARAEAEIERNERNAE